MRNALVTGANGDIGGAIARKLVKRGYHVYTPARDMAKPSVQALLHIPEMTVSPYNIENADEASNYIRMLANDGVTLDVVVLAAGTFKWDDDKMFNGSVDAAIQYLDGANYVTKVNILNALNTHMRDQQRHMVVIGIGSHAANHPEWKEAGERGYVIPMEKVQILLVKLDKEGRFKKTVLDEPGLIDTEMARKEFTKERLGFEPDWENADKPLMYADKVLEKTGL